jgi:hypothetical protein
MYVYGEEKPCAYICFIHLIEFMLKVQWKIRDLVLLLNLANGDIIVSNIMNGVGGLRSVHHGV